MPKKNIAFALAVAAVTFLILLLGTKTYDIFALQKPLTQVLTKYHITGVNFEQGKKIVLKLEKNSNLKDAVQVISKKLGDVNIDLQDNASPQIKAFYDSEEVFVLQYISKKEYGTLQNYLQEKSLNQKFQTQIFIDDKFLYLKISDQKSALYKMFPLRKESEV